MGPGCFYPGNAPDSESDGGSFHASMGPGCFYPGNGFASSRLSQICNCFNGAGMFLSRKYRRQDNQARPPHSLQWGRDVSIPEMLRAHGRIAVEHVASMGPGCFYPGNKARGFQTVPMYVRFNGAGMFLSRKCRHVQLVAECRVASMGPGYFYPGNILRRSRLSGRLMASMGPGCFYPGNARFHRGTGLDGAASMGPGCFYPGNRSDGFLTHTAHEGFNGAGMFLSRK